MRMNNFQRLFDEEERAFAEAGNEEVLNKVQGTLQLFRIVGEVADIYLSSVLSVLVTAVDPDTDMEQLSSGTVPPPSDGAVEDPGLKGPKEPPQ